LFVGGVLLNRLQLDGLHVLEGIFADYVEDVNITLAVQYEHELADHPHFLYAILAESHGVFDTEFHHADAGIRLTSVWSSAALEVC
jgi:hypothetical protein